MKRIYNEPIFTAVYGKSPTCDSTDILVHIYLSKHVTGPAELPAVLKLK